MALKLFWRCEGVTLDGTHDYTAGDSEAVLASGAAINADAARFGTNGLDIPSAGDTAAFTVSSGDLIAAAEGAIAFSFRLTSFVDGAFMFSAFNSGAGNNHIRLAMVGADDATGREIAFTIRLQGDVAQTITTTDADLAEGTWYALVARWEDATNSRRLEIYNADGTLRTSVEDTSTNFSIPTGIDTIYIGDGLGASGVDYHIDNFFIADDYAEPVEDYLDITSYTEYGVTPSSVTIIDADDETFYNGETITITGSGFGATTGLVYISPTDDVEDAGIEQQSVVEWTGDTSITFQAVLGDLTPGATCYLFVVNSDTESNATGYQVSFSTPVAVSTLNRTFGVRGAMRTLVTM